ncbi:formate/nitrite transporter family protein [Aureibacter tunicatorum]|uniref:Formate/nitrite transporter n=1 Tax=Aureibacter tunicatorum TaxID=866807 RepID=A0AAE4BTD6_9BACT|nr:formate/nitrite transporter family protein [Aureibacter tunicatorum]MDR6239830.1 formate/nitrite transporter [Aureibacter tunicatorum]BDD04305.1 formate transporter [Aureibacter tunicatorum]
MGIFTPKEIAYQAKDTAFQKSAYSIDKFLLLSFLGGAFVAFGSILAIIVGGGSPEIAAANPGLQKFMFGAVFPVGLILVIIAGADLFTSDCAIMTIPVLKKEMKPSKLLKVWTLSYFGNFIGALFVVYFITYLTGILKPEPFSTASIDIAIAKTSNPFFKTFWKGVGANWLVCLAAWSAIAAKDVTGKVLAIWFPVMTFVTFGFEHSIANMFFIPNAMTLGADISWTTFIVKNLIPATLGNIVGGALFVGTIYTYIYVNDK